MISFSVVLSLAIGLVLSFKFDDVDVLLPGTISREAAMDTLRRGSSHDIRSFDDPYCTSSWRSSLWLSCFRWFAGFILPLLLLAIPTGIQLSTIRKRLNKSLRKFQISKSLKVI